MNPDEKSFSYGRRDYLGKLITRFHSPERALWAMVLLQAVKDLHGQGYYEMYSNCRLTRSSYKEKKREQYRRQALFWFRSPDYRPGSFLYICDVLGVDPEMIKKHIVVGKVLRTELDVLDFRQEALADKMDIKRGHLSCV